VGALAREEVVLVPVLVRAVVAAARMRLELAAVEAAVAEALERASV
jgi:hypothetical protein